MIEYTVVKGYDLEIMIKKINALLLQGWALYGNIVMTQGNTSMCYAQALTRKIEIHLNPQ